MKQYVFIDGYRVGLWRCPHCFRGLKENVFCMVHGEIINRINVLESEEARLTAIEIRVNNETEKITYKDFIIKSLDWNKKAKYFLKEHGWNFEGGYGFHELFNEQELTEKEYESFCNALYTTSWKQYKFEHSKALMELDKGVNADNETIITLKT